MGKVADEVLDPTTKESECFVEDFSKVVITGRIFEPIAYEPIWPGPNIQP